MQEAEIFEFLQKMESRGCDKTSFKHYVNTAITVRHVSEDFLIQFSQYITMKVLKEHYAAEIASQEYPTIALLVESNPNED